MKLSIIITDFIAGVLLIVFCIFYKSPKIFYAWATITNLAALVEFYFSDKEKNREDGIISWLFTNKIKRDEREKLIFNRSTQLSLVIGFFAAFYFYNTLREADTYKLFKYTWFIWCFGIIFISRSILMFVYTNFVKIEK